MEKIMENENELSKEDIQFLVKLTEIINRRINNNSSLKNNSQKLALLFKNLTVFSLVNVFAKFDIYSFNKEDLVFLTNSLIADALSILKYEEDKKSFN